MIKCTWCGADGANARSYRDASPGTFILNDSGKPVTWVNRQGDTFCSSTHRRHSNQAAREAAELAYHLRVGLRR